MPPRNLAERRPRAGRLAVLLAIAVGLEFAAGLGLSYVVGFAAMRRALDAFDPDWLPAVFAGVALTFIGEYLAVLHIYRAEGGPQLSSAQMRAVVTAGMGGFLSRGGTKLDEQVLRSAGADQRDARIRVEALGGLEHGALGILGCVAGIVCLASSQRLPPMDFKLPWTILPVPGFALAFWLAGRAKNRDVGTARGWRARRAEIVDMILFVRRLFSRPRQEGAGIVGMLVFWLGGAAATWAALACFGAHVNGAAFMLGFGTGAVFTRRTGPLAGAGVLMLCLPLTIWDSGAPFAAAVLGVFVYRVVSAWLPTPLALWSLRLVREVGRQREGTAEAVDPVSPLASVPNG